MRQPLIYLVLILNLILSFNARAENMNITNTQVKELIDQNTDMILLDVREPHELEQSKLENITHIPLGQLQARFEELPKDKKIIAICRTGGRSGQATSFLRAQGFADTWNMTGGMNAWATEIDTSLKTY